MINNTNSYKNSSMPIWQWVAIYLLIAVIIYGIVYYVFFSNPSGPSYSIPVTQTQVNTPTVTSTSPSPSQNMPIITTSNAAQGNILTDPKGMSLYVFDKDTVGVSNCNGSCASIWPPILATSGQGSLPVNLTIIKRADGSSQYAWKGMPLYFYSNDQKAGDITGDGFNKVWHLARP